MQPVAHILLLAHIRGGFQPKENLQLPRAAGFQAHSSPTPARWGLKVIVSKRKDSAYRSGRSPDWLKMKNADAPAVKREAEEDWGR